MRKLLLLLLPLALQAGIILDATGKSVRVTTSAATNVDYHASFVDVTTTTFAPTATDGQITTATTTTLVAAPASSTQRQVKLLTVTNTSTSTANAVTALLTVSGTDRRLFPTVTLAAGESLQYEDAQGWYILDAFGRRKIAPDAEGIGGAAFDFYKVGTAAEAAGQWYSWSKDSGFPGAWVPGTPGLTGRTTDGTTTTDAGCLTVGNAATGANYLAALNATGSAAHNLFLQDWLWVGTGAVVTTTTGQTVNSITWPARDLDGATEGKGVGVAVLVTTATTNAGAVTNTTLTYTNSDGTGSRTATIASFPATATIGTFVPFQLQAGDRGVQSIQTLTLGTSYAAGAIALIAYRTIIGQPMTLANVGSPAGIPVANPGVRLFSGTCLMPVGIMSNTAAVVIAGSGVVLNR